MNIGEIMKETREKLRISQRALADILGVSNSTIYYIEKGIRTPGPELIYKINQWLKHPSYFVVKNHRRVSLREVIPVGQQLLRELKEKVKNNVGKAILFKGKEEAKFKSGTIYEAYDNYFIIQTEFGFKESFHYNSILKKELKIIFKEDGNEDFITQLYEYEGDEELEVG